MESQKKIKASAVAALGVMAFGLLASTPAASHSLKISVDKLNQAVNVNISEGIVSWGNARQVAGQCKQALVDSIVKENTACLNVPDFYPGDGYSLKVRNLRHVGHWDGGVNRFWVRTAFDIYVTGSDATIGSGHVDEAFAVNRR